MFAKCKEEDLLLGAQTCPSMVSQILQDSQGKVLE